MTNQIATKIKAHRAALKMTQAQYGAALDEPVSGQTISCWERGQWTPTTRHLISLSKLMTEPTEQPSLDDYASATTDQLMADAVSAATLPSDALAMSAELTRRYEDTDDMTQIATPAHNPQAVTIDWQAPDITTDLENLIEPPSEYFKMRTALYMGQRDEAEAELDDLLTDEERAAIEEICTPRTTGIGEQLLSLHGLFGLGVSAHRVSQALGDNVAKGYRTNDYPCVYWPNQRAVLANVIRSLIRVNLTDNPRRPTALLALAKRIEQGRVASPERYKAMLYNDPIVRKIVTMTDNENGYFSPHLASFEALGFCAREIPQAINHIQAPPNGVWRWPEHKSNLIALAQELKGQLYMHAVGCSPWGDRVKIDLNIARMDAVITRLKLNDILFDSDTVQESPEDMTNIIPQAATNPQNVTIDWQALIEDHDGVKGVSLRHLVSLGLYGKYQDAAAALMREDENLTVSVKLKARLGERGPLSEDYIITDLRAVQRFCARARTEMGGRILEVILDHHDELQAMLAGDAAALARHEQAKAPAMSALDAFSAAVAALQEQAARTAAIEARTIEVAQQVAQIERRLDTTPIAGEKSAYQVAEDAGIKSSAGRPHSSAVVSLIYDMGLAQEGLARQVTTEVNGKLADSWRIHSTGAAMIKRELARLAQRGVVLEDGRIRFEIKGRDRVFTVYR